MHLNIVTIEDLINFENRLLENIYSMLSNEKQTNKSILKSPEVRKILGISATTLQTLRINGTLPYTKVGGTLYYEMADVENMLQKNKRTNDENLTTKKTKNHGRG